MTPVETEKTKKVSDQAFTTAISPRKHSNLDKSPTLNFTLTPKRVDSGLINTFLAKPSQFIRQPTISFAKDTD
jgi:hypothetical protein